MAELTIPPSINDDRTQALAGLIARLEALDLSSLLIYRLDSVPDSALAFLAWQFDILSPLWQLVAPFAVSIDALTDIDSLTDTDLLSGPSELADGAAGIQRSLLKIAIPLHRYRGTPSAIKRALGSLGWTNVILLEDQASWGGNAYPDNQGWAVFRVLIDLSDGQSVETGAIDTLVAAVNFFKPARAWLDSVWFIAEPVSDAVNPPEDSLTLGGIASYQLDASPAPVETRFTLAIVEAPLAEQYGPITPLYSGHYRHSGITHGANEPIVADSALILNGLPLLHGG
ncbi:MAG TPA: phage tail protein [Candidatus Binataceae bacterium]